MTQYSINTSSEQHKQLKLRAISEDTTISQLVIDACVAAGYFEPSSEPTRTSAVQAEMDRLDKILATPYEPTVPLTEDGHVDLTALRARGKLSR